MVWAYNPAMAWLCALLAGLLLVIGTAVPSAQVPERPLALVAEFDGIVHPVSAEYLNGIIDQADTSGADVVRVRAAKRPAACSIPRARSSRG